MTPDFFRKSILQSLSDFRNALSTDRGDWIVKGFIDVYQNIYTISVDTKVVSKIIELLLFPVVSTFASKHGFKMILCDHQNHYPDLTFVSADGTKFAVDLKSTYRISDKQVNGFTLGAFTGYFRHRSSVKNCKFPYESYSGHFVFGIIYSRNDAAIDERRSHKLEQLQDIVSVVRDFDFIFQEKWKIAGDLPGSGNTKNIGSIKDVNKLTNGLGPFSSYGEPVFDDYWMNYMTKDMARAIDSKIPYKNLKDYLRWKQTPLK